MLRACVIGCGRMGATIDDEIRGHPTRTPTLPWAHAAAFAESDRAELTAVSDVDPEKAERIRERYGAKRSYLDYREMILTEKPDIVSIATRPGPHAEMTVFAAENGVKGIYCEKPLCCSMEEADAMVEAVERSGAKFNYGVNRRYTPLFRKMRRMIEEGAVGNVQACIAFCGVGSAMWSHTHAADLLLNMAQDSEVSYAQGALRWAESDWDGNTLRTDPGVEMGYARFKNGVHGYFTAASGYEFEVSGTKGKLRTHNDYSTLEWRTYDKWSVLQRQELEPIPAQSPTLNLIAELADAVENDGETTGNIQIARRSQEIMFGLVESSRLGGVPVPLPLENRGLRVMRDGW